MPPSQMFSEFKAYSNKMHFVLRIIVVAGIIFFFLRIFKPNQHPVIGLQANPQRTADFTQYNSDASNISWSLRRTFGKLISSPVVKDNTIYISTLQGNSLYAIDYRTGALLWKFTAEDDIPFSPVVTNKYVYITSTDGRLYSLNKINGKKNWEFTTSNFYSIATSPIFWNNMIYFGGRDTYLHAINANTGKESWKYKTQGYIDSSPLIINNTIYFGGFDTYVYALSAITGKEKWKFKTNGRIISSPASQNATLYIGSSDGNLYAIDSLSGKKLWSIQVNGAIETAPEVYLNTVIVSSRNNILYAIDTDSKQIRWQKHIDTGPYTTAAVRNNTVYIGSIDGNLYAIDALSGTDKWSYNASARIENAPAVLYNSVLFTAKNGSLYILNANTGKPAVTQSENATSLDMISDKPSAPFKLDRMNIKNTGEIIGQYNIYEITVNGTGQFSSDEWQNASISAVFVAQNNKKSFRVSGFYYDSHTWKIRFNPIYADTWNWVVSFAPAFQPVQTWKGTFVSTRASDRASGFIQKNSDNQRRFTSSNGSLFHPIGIETCLSDFNDNGFPMDELFIDEKNVTLDQYVSTLAPDGTGFNMYRFGIDNCSFPLWRFNEFDQNRPLRSNGIWADDIVKILKKNKFHIWMSIYGFHPFGGTLVGDSLDKAKKNIQQYLDYVISRYASYVDVWELGNESHLSTEWITFVTEYIHSIDPYRHLITTSFERPELDAIDLSAPHRYDTSPLWLTDEKLASYINYSDWGKPIVFGEFGNKIQNWDPESATRMRVHLWTTFFLQAGLIFWDTSHTRNYLRDDNANIYLGQTERSYVKSFHAYIDGISANIQSTKTFVSNPDIRSYAAYTPTAFYGYLYHFIQQDLETSTNITIPPLSWEKAVITWIDPVTEKVLLTEEISNKNPITSPRFAVDIAYYVKQGNIGKN